MRIPVAIPPLNGRMGQAEWLLLDPVARCRQWELGRPRGDRRDDSVPSREDPGDRVPGGGEVALIHAPSLSLDRLLYNLAPQGYQLDLGLCHFAHHRECRVGIGDREGEKHRVAPVGVHHVDPAIQESTL